MPPEPISGNSAVKWYLKAPMVLIAILAVGPFAIPLIWMSPAFRSWQKAALTAITVIVTLWMAAASADIYRRLLKEMQDLQAALN
ncbi:MAG: hypothetical protein V1682_07385 [Candidatus Omnitrophota bacterium]